MNAIQKHDSDLLSECDWMVGVDEAGRGALAGPVVAGACVLSKSFFADKRAVEVSRQINDSKQLKASQREVQLQVIEDLRDTGTLDVAVAAASVGEIEELNILGATRLAMKRALEKLSHGSKGLWQLPSVMEDGPLFREANSIVKIIVDGRPLKPFQYAHRGLVKGDGLSLAIAMASIAAKVTRDRMMQELALEHPDYDFHLHKGYGTAKHRELIRSNGPCEVHRSLFLRKVLGTDAS